MKEVIALETAMNEIAKFHFILDEGRKGNHLLFKPDRIRHAFQKDPGQLSTIFETNLDEINRVLNHTFKLNTFEDKRSYLEELPDDIQDALVFGYFQLLENSDGISRKKNTTH